MTDIEKELEKTLYIIVKGCRAMGFTPKQAFAERDKVKAEVLALIADQEKAAFLRGRVAEARICEKARRHD